MLVPTLSSLNALKTPAKTPAIFLSCFYHKSLRWTTHHLFKSEALSFVNEMKELNSSDWVQLRNCNLGFSIWASQMENAVESKWKYYKFLLFVKKITSHNPPQYCYKRYIEQFTAFLHIFIPFLLDIFFDNVGKHSVSFMGNTNSSGRSKSLPC